MKCKSAGDVRKEFIRAGVSISEWAIGRGFSPNSVFNVLSGRNQGLRGKAHDVAVALGLKHGVPRDEARIGK